MRRFAVISSWFLASAGMTEYHMLLCVLLLTQLLGDVNGNVADLVGC